MIANETEYQKTQEEIRVLEERLKRLQDAYPLGNKVIITGREASTLEKTAGAIGAHPIVCDVAKKAAIDRLVQTALDKFGHIDTLLNVAGVNRRMLAEKLSEGDYDFILDINLKGPF